MGTAHYMAPEQIEHPKDVDHRADIYSVGVVFYELLTGELPLGRFEPPSRKIQVDVRVDDVVLKALEKEPRRRYQAADEVKTAVDTISSAPRAAPPQPAFVPPPDAVSVGRLKLVAATCIIHALVQLPAFAVLASVALSDDGAPADAAWWLGASFVDGALFIGIFWHLRRALGEHFGFTGTHPIILTLIGANVAWWLAGAASFLGPTLEALAAVFMVGVLIVMGVGHIVLGAMLLRSEALREPLLTPMAWTAIITGVLTATIMPRSGPPTRSASVRYASRQSSGPAVRRMSTLRHSGRSSAGTHWVGLPRRSNTLPKRSAVTGDGASDGASGQLGFDVSADVALHFVGVDGRMRPKGILDETEVPVEVTLGVLRECRQCGHHHRVSC